MSLKKLSQKTLPFIIVSPIFLSKVLFYIQETSADSERVKDKNETKKNSEQQFKGLADQGRRWTDYLKKLKHLFCRGAERRNIKKRPLASKPPTLRNSKKNGHIEIKRVRVNTVEKSNFKLKGQSPIVRPSEALKTRPKLSIKSDLSNNSTGIKEKESPKKNWSQSVIEVKPSWGITQGEKEIIVAVIDTGVDIYHKNLNHSIWVNAGEQGIDERGEARATNGRDDDNNGFIDDVHGWDFAHNSNDLRDQNGHGTHVAGIISAKGDKKTKVQGVAPGVRIMVLKYTSPGMRANPIYTTALAIEYAIKMGAQIINYSSGGRNKSYIEKEAIKRARDKNILFVSAAGNEGHNLNRGGFYPAGYGLNNIISVSAMNSNYELIESSNFGTKKIDISAPGERIYSTLPNNRHGFMTGTSQATAFVSGVAALILSKNKKMSVVQLKNKIIVTGQHSQKLAQKTKNGVSVNSYRALASRGKHINAFDTKVGVSKVPESEYIIGTVLNEPVEVNVYKPGPLKQ